MKNHRVFIFRDTEHLLINATTLKKKMSCFLRLSNKTLSEQRQKEIFEQFEKVEKDVVGHGIHKQYHELLNQLKIKYIG